jgi:HEAT repeat protein
VVCALEEKVPRGFLAKLALGDRFRVSKRDIQHVFFLSDSSEQGALAHIRGGLFRLALAAAFWIMTCSWMIENQRPFMSNLAYRKWKIDFAVRFRFADRQNTFLLSQLDDPDPEIRKHVLDRLGYDWGTRAAEWVQPWARALKNQDPAVRARAAVILGRIHSEPSISVPALVAALHDSDARVVGDAAAAFKDFGEAAAPAIPRLIELIESGDLEIQRKAFWGLRSSKLTEKALPALLRQLKHAEPEIRREALHCIGKVGAPAGAVLDDLIAALKDDDGTVRDSAAAAIGDLGPSAERAVPALIEALADRRNGDRLPTFAIRALGAIGPAARPAIPAMIKTLDGGGDYRASDIESALSRMGPDARQEAIPHYIEQIRSDNRSAQMAASKSLGKMGRDARSAIPALEALILSDVDGSVRAAAERALAKIR